MDQERQQRLYQGGDLAELLGTVAPAAAAAEDAATAGDSAGGSEGAEATKSEAEIIRDLKAELKLVHRTCQYFRAQISAD